MKEQQIHDEIRQMLQWVADEYGIRIDSIHTDWIDTGPYPDGPRFLLHGLNMDTTTKK